MLTALFSSLLVVIVLPVLLGAVLFGLYRLGRVVLRSGRNRPS